ncbi:MAG: Pycsar system effector family protein [Parasphingorhabdus sp.]
MVEERKWPDDAVYALRTTQQHHVQLSLMADHKANMLIGATFIVFTLAIGQSRTGDISIPLMILAIAAFASAGLAAIAVMPAFTPRKDGPANLLFFGGFSSLSEEEFIERLLSEEFRNQEMVYRAMLRDIYQMGIVLGRKKFRYLGWAYRVFLIGLTMTFVTYIYEQFAGAIA